MEVVVFFFRGCGGGGGTCGSRGKWLRLVLLPGQARGGAVARLLDAVRDGAVLSVGDLAAEEDGARDLEADDARVGVRAEARGGTRQAGQRVVAGEERRELGQGGFKVVADVDDFEE
jgi:hypothetical protein